MDIVEYLKSLIDSCSKGKIKFKNNSGCLKNSKGLCNWVSKNVGDILNDNPAIFSDGLDNNLKKIEENFDEIIKHFTKDYTVEYGEEISNILSDTGESIMHNLVPTLNVEANHHSGTLHPMMDKITGRYSKVTYSAWESKQDKEYVAICKQRTLEVVVRYIPNDVRAILPKVKHELKGWVHILNTYDPPDFKLKEIDEPEIHPMVMGFLRKLFVNDKCFDFMMESVWYVLNDRLQVIPVLNGGTGIGKGLFTEILLGNLVGEENLIIAPNSWDKSSFNAWLLNKQLIIFDEAKIVSNGPDANVDSLKRNINDKLNVERKGFDADSLTKNYASFFITSNNGAKRFRLELDNRRFCPIDVTDEKIEKNYPTPEEREKLVSLLKDENEIANFYWWVQKNWNPAKRNPKRTPHTILQCDSLYKFQYESLDIWQEAIVNTILSKEANIYTFAEVNMHYRKLYAAKTGKETNAKRSMSIVDAKDFLQTFKYYGDKEPMGHFENDSDNLPILVVAKKYKIEETINRTVATNSYDEL